MKTFKELLINIRACEEAREWADNKTIEEVIETCHRGDWLLWLAQKVNVDIRPLTLAKARCAKTVLHLMKDQRSVDAVNISEAFGLGKATEKELKDTDAAAAAAYAAAYAAAADAADADAADAAYAKRKNQQETADICRRILTEDVLAAINNL